MQISACESLQNLLSIWTARLTNKGFFVGQKKRKTTTMDDNKIGRTILRKNEWYIPSRYVLCVWYLGWGYAIYEFLHEYRVYLLITTQLHAFCILSLWKDESFITSFLTEFFGSFSVFSGIMRLFQQRKENANAMISYEVAFSWSSVMFLNLTFFQFPY